MNALDLIKEEQEHAREKGYTVGHDAALPLGSIAQAAQGYLDKALTTMVGYEIDEPPFNWPWEPELYKPRDSELENLVLAASLIASEIDAMLLRLRAYTP